MFEEVERSRGCRRKTFLVLQREIPSETYIYIKKKRYTRKKESELAK